MFLNTDYRVPFYNTARNRKNLSASGSSQNFESDWWADQSKFFGVGFSETETKTQLRLNNAYLPEGIQIQSPGPKVL